MRNSKVSYRSNGISGISTLRGNGTLQALGDVSGRNSTCAVTANLAYDIPIRPFGLQPSVGAGVGYGWLNLGGVRGNELATFRLPQGNSFGGPGAPAPTAVAAPAPRVPAVMPSRS